MSKLGNFHLSPAPKRILSTILTLVGLAALLSAIGCTIGGSNTATESKSAVHQLSITATASGWEAPAAVPAGWTAITLDNQSQGMRQAAFYRLADDKTMADVAAAAEAGMEGAPPWLTPYGGVSGVMPGGKPTVIANLPAGQYIVIDPVPEADGVPGMAKGYMMPLTVELSAVNTAPPEADSTIELADYAFTFNEQDLKSGRQTLKISNSSTVEPHEAVIVKLDPGKTVEDFLAAFAPDAPPGPPPGQIVAGTAPFSTMTENYFDVELEAGAQYAVICFLPSMVHEGAPHFTLGMIREFTLSN